jgi:hypothetical protein
MPVAPEVDTSASTSNYPGPYTWVVYVIRDSNGDPLYVGSSTRLLGRLQEHKRRQDWWPLAHLVTWYPIHRQERDQRAWQESDVIGALAPPYNVNCNGGADSALGAGDWREDALAEHRSKFRTTVAERRRAARLRWINGQVAGRRGPNWFLV